MVRISLSGHILSTSKCKEFQSDHMKEEHDDLPKVLDQHETVDDEDPYRGLKIVERIVWLIVLSITALVILVAMSESAFSSSGPRFPNNGDFS